MSTVDIDTLIDASGVGELWIYSLPSDIERAVRKLGSLSKGLNNLQKEALRSAAIGRLKLQRITAPARLLRAALDLASDTGSGGKKGSSGSRGSPNEPH